MPGRVDVVSLGPGAMGLLTPESARALRECEVAVGYRPYLDQVMDLVQDKEVRALAMGEERQRVETAVHLAEAGRRVALVSGGDAGIYGMGGLVYEHLAATGWKPGATGAIEVQVLPGVTAASAAAALLGAPLAADFAVVSLSDHYAPWSLILRRVEAVAAADMVLALYEPASDRRPTHILEARRVLLGHRGPETPVGVVRDAYRPGQKVTVTTLGEMDRLAFDMRTVVVIGNSQTRTHEGTMFTPRRYEGQAGPAASAGARSS